MNARPLAALVVAAILAGLLGAGSPGIARAEDALPLAGIVVAVDPGHNGGNAAHRTAIRRLVWTGTGWRACATVGTATVDGYAEHRFNWSVALRVKARLEALGATVRLTRPSNTGVGPCVDVRGRFGTAVGADLTVSIHADGSASTHRGFYVMRPGLVAGYTDDIVGRSAALARAMRAGLLGAGLRLANYYTSTGIRKRTDFATFNLSDIPVVMVELGNMKNAGDARRMRSSTGRDRYAAGIVAGIRRYLGR